MTKDFMPAYDLPTENRNVALARRPDGIPLASDFRISVGKKPTVGDGKALVRTLYLSADPVQRGWCANEAVMPIGAVMKALGVGVVIESRMSGVKEGDVVFGFLGWQDYAAVSAEDVLSYTPEPRAPISLYAGALGMPGVTAYLALEKLAPPGPDDEVLVSTAAGAVGSVVGQICRAKGARTVGLTGSTEKVQRCLDRFGYDVAMNYKEIDLEADIKNAAPDGYSIYFDNTGGPILDNAIRSMAKYGRIIQCGTAATPSWSPPPPGWRNERDILTRVLTWSGFYIFDHAAAFNEAVSKLTDLYSDGKLDCDEDIDEGYEAVPGSLEVLFSGANNGKKLIFVGRA